jgi:two-component system, LytTR family, sensor histidine kinase AlgZ
MISFFRRGKFVVRQYGYWIFAVGVGSLLVLLEDLDVEPFFSLSATIYGILLLYWAARWLFGQIRATFKQKKAKTNIELLHLQSQVSPHFFFNTLNNLYGLVEKDAKKAKQLILNLSDMMRYSIYEGQKEVVTLEQEVTFINNYIELHTARYHKKIEIQFSKDIKKEGISLRPLLFIILVENAFKHGVENLIENAYVHINLIANENEICFVVENNFENNEPSEAQGIGLKNLQRRLELVYSKKHSLSLSIADNIYSAHLILKLT